MYMSKNTICARVVGGLGNQLFIYAFARSESLKNKYKVVFDLDTGFAKDNYGRKPLLDKHIPSLSVASKKTIYLFYLTKLFPILSRILFKSEIVVEPDFRKFFNLNPESLGKRSNLFIQGYFQSYLYSNEFAEQIKSDIKLDFHKTELVQDLATQITCSNSVSIHVRRMQYDNLLEVDYYLRAIELIKRNTENPTFFIFSDDMDWCKKNILGPDLLTLVTHDVDDEAADLWLMTQCKHHIIANSSFSWWGAWLSKNNNKVVVAPAQTQIGVKGALYPEDWILS